MELFDYERLSALAREHADDFQSANPFPSVVIDNFLPEPQFEFIHQSFPSLDSTIWKTPNNVHTISKSVIRRGPTGLKENVLNNINRNILYQFNSATFLDFLEKISNIKGLCPDPYLHEAGYHLSRNGGHLDIHADYSHHDRLGLERRLNILFYLNKQWSPSFKGAIGLYNTKLQLEKLIEPISNRLLIFATSNSSYHGFPDKLDIPSWYMERFYGRKSIAMYYYTVPTGRRPHKIIFPEDPGFTFTPTSL